MGIKYPGLLIVFLLPALIGIASGAIYVENATVFNFSLNTTSTGLNSSIDSVQPRIFTEHIDSILGPSLTTPSLELNNSLSAVRPRIFTEHIDSILDPSLTTPSLELNNSLSAVRPRIYTEHIDSILDPSLTTPSLELNNSLSAVRPRIFTEHIDSIIYPSLTTPSLELNNSLNTVRPRIFTEHIDSIFNRQLNVTSPELDNSISKVKPRIFIESVDMLWFTPLINMTPDPTIPDSITNLHETGVGTTWINWTWDNPNNADFGHVIISINGTWKANTSANYFDATGLNLDTTYEIAIKTADIWGNVNESSVRDTAKTLGYVADISPPNGVTDLKNTTYAPNYINWSWINPSDTDFSHVMVYLNGIYQRNVTAPANFYNTTDVNPDTEYIISTHTVDTSGNINSTWMNNTTRTAPSMAGDITPPASIKNPHASSFGTTWINWTWTNPSDFDFNHTMLYLDGSFVDNFSITYYNVTNLLPSSTHTISTHTVDTSGNINQTWINDTALTAGDLSNGLNIDVYKPENFSVHPVGETLRFDIVVTDSAGNPVNSGTSAYADLSGPNDASRQIILTKNGTNYTGEYIVQKDDPRGIWIANITAYNTTNSGRVSVKIIIIGAYIIQPGANSRSYVLGETANFSAGVVKPGNPSQILTDNNLSLNMTVYHFNSSTPVLESGGMLFNDTAGLFYGDVDTGLLGSGLFTVVFKGNDTSGSVENASMMIGVSEDFSITIGTDRVYYDRGELVNIFGTVRYDNNSPISNANISVQLNLQGYKRSYSVITNETGSYNYTFRPFAAEAGNYSIKATVSNIGLQRTAQSDFTIYGLYLAPESATLNMAENSTKMFNFTLYNLGDTKLTGITTVIKDIDNSDTVTATIISADLLSEFFPYTNTSITIQINAGVSVSDNASFIVEVTTDQNSNEISEFKVNIFSPNPIVRISPENILIGLNKNQTSIKTVTIENIGYGVLKNVTLLQPENNWSRITSNTSSGDIMPGENASFDIHINSYNVDMGDYFGSVNITSDNYQEMRVNINAYITDLKNGSLMFDVEDNFGQNISEVNISLVNETTYQEYYATTNSTGFALIENLPIGRYIFEINSNNQNILPQIGSVIVEPMHIPKRVNVIMTASFITFEWDSIPTSIDDWYTIVLKMKFETDVPIPILAAFPPYLQYDLSQGDVRTDTLTIANLGLVSIYNVSVMPIINDNVIISPLVSQINEIKAKSSVQLPYRISLSSNASPCQRFFGNININGKYIHFIDGRGIASYTGANVPVVVKTPDLCGGKGSITGQVTNAKDGNPLGRVLVSIDGKSTHTDDNGNYFISEVSAGTRQITASKLDFYLNSKKALIITDETTVTNFELEPIPEIPKSYIHGRVRDKYTGYPIESARVATNGGNAKTDNSGYYSISNVPVGSNIVSASADRYFSDSKMVPVTENGAEVNFYLIPIETGNVMGIVTNEEDGTAIEGAYVNLGRESTSTDSSGSYSFFDTNTGNYDIVVSKNGFYSKSTGVIVKKDQTNRKDIQLAPIPTGTITGIVTDERNGIPIGDARVLIEGSSKLTNYDGSYTFDDITIGNHRISVSKKGYYLSSNIALINKDETTIMDFNLKQIPDVPKGSISGTVVDASNGKPLDLAFVIANGGFGITDISGNYLISDVPIGTNNVMAEKSGYDPAFKTTEVKENLVSIVDFQLKKINPKIPQCLECINGIPPIIWIYRGPEGIFPPSTPKELCIYNCNEAGAIEFSDAWAATLSLNSLLGIPSLEIDLGDVISMVFKIPKGDLWQGSFVPEQINPNEFTTLDVEGMNRLSDIWPRVGIPLPIPEFFGGALAFGYGPYPPEQNNACFKIIGVSGVDIGEGVVTISPPPDGPWQNPVFPRKRVIIQNIHEVVTLSVSQNATMERDAFWAGLGIRNRLPDKNIENVRVSIKIKGYDGLATDKFFIKSPILKGISNLDGTGIISSLGLAKGQWLIIPKSGAAGVNPEGTKYNISANISYSVGGVNFEIVTNEIEILVKPQPELVLDYFIPSDVIANKPFKLAVRVTNEGYGEARNFSIETAQPVIYQNPSGLLLDFEIIRSQLQGQERSTSLKVDFGDFLPGESKLAWWDMVTSIDGTFTEFTGDYTHSSDLGGMETSLIKRVNKYIIQKELGFGNIGYDFLANLQSDENHYVLFDSSNGNTMPLDMANYNVVNMPTPQNPVLDVSLEDYTGKWVIVSIDDPYGNKVPIEKVIRTKDGAEIPSYNYWMRNGRILIVDHYEEGFDGKYRIIYSYNKFDVIQLTDVHIGPDPLLCSGVNSESFACLFNTYRRSIIEFNNVKHDIIAHGTNVVLITGDIVEWNNAAQYGLFNSLTLELKNNNIQVYIVPGNHDRRGKEDPIIPILQVIKPINALDNYKKYIGGQSFIGVDGSEYMKNVPFSYEGYSFIGLDSGFDYDTGISTNFEDIVTCKFPIDCTPESSGLDNIYQIGLLPKDETAKILFMHHPAVDNKYDSHLKDDASGGNDNTIALNRLGFINYVNENNVSLVLSGHSHVAKFLTEYGTNVPGFAVDYVRPLFIQTRSATQDTPTGYLGINFDKDGYHIQDRIIDNPSSLDYIESFIKSPADLHVYDEFGRHTGLNANGDIETNIPNSYYFEEYKMGNTTLPAFVLLYNTGLNYRFEIVSNFSRDKITSEQTLFGFTVKHKENNSTTTINFNNVSINRNTRAYLQMNTTQINYSMQIDLNNDGLIDDTKIQDSIYKDYTPTAIILSPTNGSMWEQGQALAFEGAGEDREDGILSNLIWISDIDGVIGYGNFTTTNLSAGIQNIKLIVNDTDGQFNISNIIVTIKDTKPPVLNLDYPPENNKTFNKQEILLKGIAYDDSGIFSITVDRNLIGKENWNTLLNLNEGENKIEVVATDNKGFSTRVNRTVYYYSSLANDTYPSAQITNLTQKTGFDEVKRAWINWTWDNPKDEDFSHTIVYLDNIPMGNTSRSYINFTGLSSGADYNLSILTADIVDNINYSEVKDTARTPSLDTAPPQSITNPNLQAAGTTRLNFTWLNPPDPDFTHVMLYLNGSFKTNVPAPQNYYNFTGLDPDTLYELGTHTVDSSGNVNETWVNKTARTAPLSGLLSSTIFLKSGWNLISVPLNLTTWELGDEEAVGKPINVTPANCISSLYQYNTTSSLFEKSDHFTDWGWWPATGSESFTALEPGRGYWVMAQQNCSLTFTGTAPSDLEIPLNTGWNLIGWYSMNEAALGEESVVGNPLNVTPPNSLTSIYRYNTTSSLFEKSDHFLDWGWWPATGSEGFTKLEPGRGYWILAQNDAVWRHKS